MQRAESERSRSGHAAVTLAGQHSLNRIAGWLTGTVIGVPPVNAQTACDYFVRTLPRLWEGLVEPEPEKHLAGANAFAAGLIVFFALLWLPGTCLLTQLWLSAALAQADQVGITVISDTGVNERNFFLPSAASFLPAHIQPITKPDHETKLLH